MILVLGVGAFVRALLGSSTAVTLENVALRHQLAVLQRSVGRPRLRRWDRLVWVGLSQLWAGWRSTLVIVQPATVLAWHRQGFQLYWRWKSRRRSAGRTDHPTATWTARQIVEAFPDDTAPTYLLRDRDAIHGDAFARYVKTMEIRQVITTPKAPWQNAFSERVIGSLRRECLDHFIVLSETHLRRLLRAYIAYYNDVRPHQALANTCPRPREVEPPALGHVVAIPQIDGLHNRYTRVA